ncbi:MAG: hypothetical protein MUE85_19695 [Microscillaceae bacterium]|jgi:FSR family fosmidomycin resistance protein-like MFS transporter|nr:hypothetical protein [Microscillaceae bacterium]
MRSFFVSLITTTKVQFIDYQLIVLLGLAHALSDCLAGYLIGRLSLGNDVAEIGFLIALYNLLAFAGQMPAGWLVDKSKNYGQHTIGALLVSGIGLLIHSFSMFYAIVLVGVGSAFFHVSGGAWAYRQGRDVYKQAGIFAGPGVLGLIIGGIAAVHHIALEGYLLVGMALLMLGLGYQNKDLPRQTSDLAHISKPQNELDAHDGLMILLLLAIAMRSAVWNIFQLIYAYDYDWLLLMAIAGMLGKIVGGFGAARWGAKNYALGALAGAIPLLWGGEQMRVLLIPGVFLLQSTTPIAMGAMYRLLPLLPATAAGTTLGMGIALGGCIFYLGASPGLLLGLGVPLLGLFALVLYNFALNFDI